MNDDKRSLFLLSLGTDRPLLLSHELLELPLADEIRRRVIQDIDVFLRVLPHRFVVRVVLTQVIPFQQLRDDLVDLRQQYCLFVLEVLDEELVGDDVAVWMVLIAILYLLVEVDRLGY